MTARIYYEDQYVKEFSADVIECEFDGKYYNTILDRTAFFPEGGGQPGDRGSIGESHVINTIEKDGNVIHICDKEVNGTCACALDWDYRFNNMQQHSGEHIFSGFLNQLTGYDNVGFHMGTSEVTVDFNGPVSADILKKAEYLANMKIYENAAIEVIYPSDDELPTYNYRSKKEIQGQIRLVRIPGADLCACCGTHVKQTGEVGIVKAESMSNYKQGVRIVLKIGQHALTDYEEKNNSVHKISASLCSKTDEVAEAVEKLKEKQVAYKYEVNELKQKLFKMQCDGVKTEYPVAFDDKGMSENAEILANMLSEKSKVAVAFSGDDENGYKYAVVSKTEDVRILSKLINDKCNGRGGGTKEMCRGNVAAGREIIETSIKEYF